MRGKVPVITATKGWVMADTTQDEDRVAALETQIDELRGQLKDVRRQLSEAELDPMGEIRRSVVEAKSAAQR